MMMMGYKNDPILVFHVDDMDKFQKAIQDEGFSQAETEQDDGVMCYTNQVNEGSRRQSYIAICDSYAYLAPSVHNDSNADINALKTWIADAKESSFANTTFGTYISEGNTCGLSFRITPETLNGLNITGIPNEMMNQCEGVVCLNCDLTDNTVKFNMKYFDEDGSGKSTEPFAEYMDINAKISSEALSYMGKDESLIYAVALEDMNWDKYLGLITETANPNAYVRTMLTIAKTYLEKIDGTVAIGVDVTQDLKSIGKSDNPTDLMGGLSMTMVCETKEGEAEKLLKDAKALLDNFGMKYNDTPDGLSISIPGGIDLIHLKASDDIIAIANHPIEKGQDNATLNQINFTNYMAAMGLLINKDHAIMKELELNNGIKAEWGVDASKMEGTMIFSVDGDTADGLIETIAKMALKLQ